MLSVFLASRQEALCDAVCAVLPTSRSTIERDTADMLERQLAEQSGVVLVNRADFEAVVSEKLLRAALSAENLQSRVEVGKLVKADLLLFLRERRGRDGRAIELAVAETRRGVRLVTDLTWHCGNPRTWRP